MISLRNTCFAVLAAAPLVLGMSAAPASAGGHMVEAEGWCMPVVNTPLNVVHSSNGNVVLSSHSYECPEVAEAPPPPPAPAPAEPQRFVVYFDFDRANIRPDAASVLQEALQAARESDRDSFALTGHTDTAGPADYNLRLSLRRAESVRDWLADRGVAEGNISVAGRGQSEPAVPTGDGVPEQRNRRVEIILQ